MSTSEPQKVVCKWCGEKLPEGAEVCPLCRRPRTPDQRRPIEAAGERGAAATPRGRPTRSRQLEQPERREPLAPAPGQEAFGSLANIGQIMRGDRLLGAVLVLMAVQVVLTLLAHMWFSAVISGLMLFGVVTFRSWGFWIAVVGAGSIVVFWLLPLLHGVFVRLGIPTFPLGLSSLLGAVVLHGTARALSGFSFAISAFVLWVLWTRRDMFA